MIFNHSIVWFITDNNCMSLFCQHMFDFVKVNHYYCAVINTVNMQAGTKTDDGRISVLALYILMNSIPLFVCMIIWQNRGRGMALFMGT